MDGSWGRAGWAAMLALALAAGGASAQVVEDPGTPPVEEADGGVVPGDPGAGEDGGTVVIDDPGWDGTGWDDSGWDDSGWVDPGDGLDGGDGGAWEEPVDPMPIDDGGIGVDCGEACMMYATGVGAEAAGPGGAARERGDGDRWRIERRDTSGPNICTSPVLYAEWLCAWQGYAQP